MCNLNAKNHMSQQIMMDATFKVCPFGIFNQLLIIHVSYVDAVIIFKHFKYILVINCGFFPHVPLQHVIPIIYVLMSCKKQICYSHILDYIHDDICSLECVSFMTDFERAMRNAIALKYPDAEHRTCWFHFCQAVKRNASKTINGFIHMIRNNVVEREIYYKILCIPLLPPELIPAGYAILEKKAQKIPMRNRSQFRAFLDYFHRQWMVAVSVCVLIRHTCVRSFIHLFHRNITGRA